MNELVFEVTQDVDGGYCAECLTIDIFTQAETWDELRTSVREAVRPTSSMTSLLDGSVCTSSIQIHVPLQYHPFTSQAHRTLHRHLK